ncbi:hypothetical protein Glove_166g131 [Diversispora epigaea]|uniref:Uncharacterized protein n=1 Tax=Diversispora epigaea TaxID=1348612 RepID=A0A397IZ75_9GLOM|nr:hypothetical protein Glove_166g131 [Diversispora epigaea]
MTIYNDNFTTNIISVLLPKVRDAGLKEEGIWNNLAFTTDKIQDTQSEGTYITDIIVLLFRASLENLSNERLTHKIPIGKKSDVMIMAKYEDKIFELAYVKSSQILCVTCRPTNYQFGIVRIQVAGEDLYLNILVKDTNGILRYFYVDQMKIPFTKNTSWHVEPLIRLLLTLKNIIIVNQSLLIQALEQANTCSPRNATQSSIVISHK